MARRKVTRNTDFTSSVTQADEAFPFYKKVVLWLDMLYLVLTCLNSEGVFGGNCRNMAFFVLAVCMNFFSIMFLAFMANGKKSDISYDERVGLPRAREYILDALMWVAICHLLSIYSEGFLLLWLWTPLKAGLVAWTTIIRPLLSTEYSVKVENMNGKIGRQPVTKGKKKTRKQGAT